MVQDELFDVEMRAILGPHVKWDFWSRVLSGNHDVWRKKEGDPIKLYLHSSEQITSEQGEKVLELSQEYVGQRKSVLVMYKDIKNNRYIIHGPKGVVSYTETKPPWVPAEEEDPK